MEGIIKQSKKVVLLLSHRKVYEAMQAALREIGYGISDEFDGVMDADLVVMDSFYFKAGTAEFIKVRNRDIHTLLFLLKKETLEFPGLRINHIDDTLVVDSLRYSEDLFFAAADWFKKWDPSFVLDSSLLSQDFGSGLWVSLISRLEAVG